MTASQNSAFFPTKTPAGPALFDLLVLGSGVAGLAAARLAKNDGKSVLVIDKGRRLGGRVSTKRQDGFVFNHGAQFVTAKGTEFANLLDMAKVAGNIKDWQVSDDKIVQIGTPSMRDLPQFMAAELMIRQQTEITKIIHHGGHIGFFDKDGLVATGRQVIITAPAAQTGKLLADIYPELAATAGLASYDPCWTIMLGLEDDHGLGTAPLRDEAAGIALGAPEMTRSNQQSGLGAPALTIQATGQWSQQHLQDGQQMVTESLCQIWQNLTGKPLGNISTAIAHRWLYAKVTTAAPSEAPRLSNDGKLAIAGDWLGGPRVEQAFDSGQQAYRHLN
ncbi:NAD(P)-binding protein [Alphaproteobacteria bacterium]|nr:NAD(P)-binding protein [Alphaproteobacteria bacterium]